MKKTTKSRKTIKLSRFKLDEITLVLIVAIIIIVVSISQKSNQAASDAQNIMKVVLDDNSAALPNDIVIGQKELEKIQGMNYEQLKKYLNMKNDFCLYIEDENGNIILAKGSAKLSRDGIYCKE
jgi:hypothetical protein